MNNADLKKALKRLISGTYDADTRFKEVYNAILSFISAAFPELMVVDNKTAWSKIPPKMVEYIKSLPEYDEEVFKAITEE